MHAESRQLHELADEQALAVYADDSRPRSDREAAFHLLVDRFQRRVFAVCLRVLGDAADAEDATQEVFLRLARSAAGFRGDAKLSTWLYTVARNVATDRVRYNARRPATPVDDMTVVADERSADDTLGAHASLLAIRQALDQLDDTSRELLVLVAVEGLTYVEAAAASDLPVGTVKSRVSRARIRLGQMLAEAELASSPRRPTDTAATPVDPTPRVDPTTSH